MENLEKKILVVDDCNPARETYRKLGKELQIGVDAPESFSEVKNKLENTKYSLILMDGALEYYRDKGKYEFGGYVIEDIRTGCFGSLNKDVPVVSISSIGKIPGTEERLYKEFDPEYPRRKEMAIECIKKYL